HDGQIVRINQWGRRRLGYPIEHHRDGFYVFIDMILTPENVIELDRTLKVSEEVLRHLIKRRDPKAVQKEREAHATAAAAAAAPAAPVAEAEPEPQDEMRTPGEDEIAGEEAEIPSDLSTGDVEDEDIPAAIEEPSEA